MIIKSLACDGFRNLDLFRCELSPKLNFFVGENGAGKTSILEAANWCVSGRSFRSHSIEHMICHGKSFFQLEMGLPSTTVSVLQAKKNTINDSGLAVKSEIFINQQKIKRKSELAKLMPVFMLSYQNFSWLRDSSKVRRQWLDWGVFHVKHEFHSEWVKLQHAVKQRNQTLHNGYKQADSNRCLDVYDKQIVDFSETITKMRADIVLAWENLYREKYSHWLSGAKISGGDLNFSFYKGWSAEHNLSDILTKFRSQDFKTARTRFGAHRAQLNFLINGVPVGKMLSQGQQKVLLMALVFSLSEVVQNNTQKQLVYLIDDLNSELDVYAQKKLISCLQEQQTQVIMTAINGDFINSWLKGSDVKKFNVKHGVITD